MTLNYHINVPIFRNMSSLHSWLELFQVAYKAVMQGVRSSDKTGYQSLLKIYRETDVSQERIRVLSE